MAHWGSMGHMSYSVSGNWILGFFVLFSRWFHLPSGGPLWIFLIFVVPRWFSLRPTFNPQLRICVAIVRINVH